MTKSRSVIAWGGITKGREETFGGDSFIHYLDIGDGCMSKLTKLYIFNMCSLLYVT